MKIFLDFDDVLFNTYKFKNKLWNILCSYGFSRQEVDSSAKSISSECFREKGRVYDTFFHISNLKKIRRFDDRKAKKEISIFLGNLYNFVFSDCAEFLENFSKNDLYLISYGEGNFQNKKIKGSGLHKYFKKIIITEGNKTKEIFKTAKREKFSRNEKIIFIDDRLENLKTAKKDNWQLITFHLRRSQGRYSKVSSSEKNREAKDLGGVLRIIKKEKIG